jgi:dTDP-4-amino-4,6-dideoxygalactose transaminase
LTNPDERFNSNYWLCNILIDPDKTGFNYEDLRLALEEANVESRPLWKPMHLQPVFADCDSYLNGVSESLFNKGLCLPAGPWVSDEDIDLIVDTIKSMLKR